MIIYKFFRNFNECLKKIEPKSSKHFEETFTSSIKNLFLNAVTYNFQSTTIFTQLVQKSSLSTLQITRATNS